MRYETITPETKAAFLTARLGQLETEHYQHSIIGAELAADETVSEDERAGNAATLASLEARLAVLHDERAELTQDTAEEADEAAARTAPAPA